MNREDILKNNYDFIDYEVYRDADHVNRFIKLKSKISSQSGTINEI